MTPGERYAAWWPSARVHEEPCSLPPRDLPEMEVQARWFSGEFGRKFTALTGEAVEIVQFGVWNRETGPDFRDAAISINGGAPVKGCIELDPDVRDWERHGHATNVAYNAVVLHVFWNAAKTTYSTQTHGGSAVPQVKLDLSHVTQKPLNPVPCAKPGRCSAPLAAMPSDQVASLLTAAAHFRLRRKAQRLRGMADAHGEDEALYQAVAEAFGYKGNQLPFLLVAQRLPLRSLRSNRGAIDALLFGASGFLPETDLARFDDQSKLYLRQLWDGWWQRRGEVQALVLPGGVWKCGGIRPMNHPHRRLGALAQLVRRWWGARRALRTANPAAIQRYFASLRDPYWDFHYTLTSKRTLKRIALVGQERVAAILVNIVLPWALGERELDLERLKALPAMDFNLRVKTGALRLFAKDAQKVPLLKSAFHQQGLIQIYEDFCCQDVSDCIRCRLPEQLKQWE